MKQKYELPKDFRFVSSVDDFEECANITRQLIEKKKCAILLGTFKEVEIKLGIKKDEFGELYNTITWDDFCEILFTEISVIIEQNVKSEITLEKSLYLYLKEKKFTDEQCKELCNEKLIKRNIVREKLMTDEFSARYNFKGQSLSSSLSDFKYEINKYIFDDRKEFTYAAIRMEVSDLLVGVEVPTGISDLLVNNKNGIKFICDKQDIDYLIMKLEEIRNKL